MVVPFQMSIFAISWGWTNISLGSAMHIFSIFCHFCKFTSLKFTEVVIAWNLVKIIMSSFSLSNSINLFRTNECIPDPYVVIETKTHKLQP